MLHIFLHFLIPLLVAFAFYHSRWRIVFLVLIATMLVDLDHLLAEPVYDPNRCSIDFHPLHTFPAIALYVILFLLPYFPGKKKRDSKWVDILHLAGLGLLIHMALDGLDCVW